MTKLKNFWIYWGDGEVAHFHLYSKEQAENIAKQYPNVTKIEEKVFKNF